MWVRRAFNSEVREGLYERKKEMERGRRQTPLIRRWRWGKSLKLYLTGIYSTYIFLGRYSKRQEIPSAQTLRPSTFR